MGSENGLRFFKPSAELSLGWKTSLESTAFDEAKIKEKLLCLDRPCYIVQEGERLGVSHEAYSQNSTDSEQNSEVVASAPAFQIDQLGDPDFRKSYGAKYSYYSGAMANGIACEELVIAMGKEGFLGSFGAAGLLPDRIEKAIHRIQEALPEGPYMFNLIHSPSEPALEHKAVELYLRYNVRCVEASAFLGLTPSIVYYRVAGLKLNVQNQVEIQNKIVAKVSRREVATKFMEPAPKKILNKLLEQKLITPQQAELAEHVPMADDITIEADSGGHTDNRPLVVLFPSIISLRDEIQAKYNYAQTIRVGAAGGIGTPQSALAVFMMGAAYVVTGSVNQACIEAGASSHTKELLTKADMADVSMAPAADMFEMGVKLQVLKRGTLFPMRAQKLYDLYRDYNSLEEIPEQEREKLEKQVFRKSLDTIWSDTAAWFSERDPEQIERAANNPKRKMALVFRWYLGLSSRWSNHGEAGREMDYQIWCGPAMGAFNNWVRNSYLEDTANLKVAEVAKHLLTGAAFLYRLQHLKLQGIHFPSSYSEYIPKPF